MGDKLITITIQDCKTLEAFSDWRRFPDSVEYSMQNQFAFETIASANLCLDGKGPLKNIITQSQRDAAAATQPEHGQPHD